MNPLQGQKRYHMRIFGLRNSVNYKLGYHSHNQMESLNANDFNDNAIYSCYKDLTVNLPTVNGWHNILVSRMSNNPLYLTQLDMTEIGRIYYRVKREGAPWTSWYLVFNHSG